MIGSDDERSEEKIKYRVLRDALFFLCFAYLKSEQRVSAKNNLAKIVTKGLLSAKDFNFGKFCEYVQIHFTVPAFLSETPATVLKDSLTLLFRMQDQSTDLYLSFFWFLHRLRTILYRSSGEREINRAARPPKI